MPEEQPALSCASFRTQLRFLVALSAISSCIGQLQQLLTALEVSGKLPNATRTVAGFTAHTLCEGEFLSNRTFESVWDYDACLFNCLAHNIFNLTSPEHSYGRFSVNNASKIVNATVLNTGTSAVYTGDIFGCQLSNYNQTTTTPTYVDDGKPWEGPLEWPDNTVNSPNKSKEVDYNSLNSAIARYFEDPTLVQGAKTRAIAVIYKGTLVAERYSPAQDVTADTRSISWSLAKSVTSALVGVRSADISSSFSVHQLASSPVWNASETASRNITVDDLLRMVSGIDWNEAASVSAGGPAGSPVTAAGEMLFEAQDGAAYVGALPQNSTPGRYFNYSTGNYQLVQYNLRKSFGSDLDYWSFARNRLFKRIGARSFAFESDPSGTLLGGSHAFATARDWARFGQLFLQDGVWNGERVLPEGWVKYSTTPTPASAGIYGAGWWLGYPGAPVDTFIGNGLLGQRVIVVPSQELVIVRLGLNFNNDFDQVHGRDFFSGISAAFPRSKLPEATQTVAAAATSLGR